MTSEPRPAGVTPPVAVVLAAVSFLALSIAALGVVSLVLDADVIPVRGLGAIPGVIGQVVAVSVFAGVLWWGLRAEPPGYLTAVPCAIGAFVGEIVGLVVGSVVTGADPTRGLAAAESIALGFPGAVIAAAGLVAGAFGVLLVRGGPRSSGGGGRGSEGTRDPEPDR
ncbi:hypothetical protein [Microbacterium trichothecenolyticum]|uniref:LytS/YehU family sensor histidine kinase n=1 Tax=Microbacterium trichothecenolyticum TaxID=69370 RepID=A0ABU0TWP3_MICTR|nr:hypothetical protein [Microbacterium trichothecenolyticum]MDQ1123364.1 LytS/YehU family sensor histidine kinase [Microbacterium trichothecenolyticum]